MSGALVSQWTRHLQFGLCLEGVIVGLMETGTNYAAVTEYACSVARTCWCPTISVVARAALRIQQHVRMVPWLQEHMEYLTSFSCMWTA